MAAPRTNSPTAASSASSPTIDFDSDSAKQLAAIEAVSRAANSVAIAQKALLAAGVNLRSLRQQVREAQQRIHLEEARLDRRKARFSKRSAKLGALLDEGETAVIGKQRRAKVDSTAAG
ncbi:hypothetical protein JCM10908_007217 [Rhodotorula pacifica]|uniref:uncharacterized protein n=1 Tax=Rhodotorula pacifica TaxID=1495444 RepID=UPI00317FCE04